jgi:hypothetical protein
VKAGTKQRAVSLERPSGHGIDNPVDESNIPDLVTFIVYELLLFGTLRYKCVKNVTIRYSFNNSNPWHG